MEDQLDILIHEYNQFIVDNQLPQLSADELLFDGSIKLKEWQKHYISDFINRWEVFA